MMSEILDFPEKKTCGNCNRFESCFAQSNALMGITVVAPWMVSHAKECPACCQWVKEIPHA